MEAIRRHVAVTPSFRIKLLVYLIYFEPYRSLRTVLSGWDAMVTTQSARSFRLELGFLDRIGQVLLVTVP